MRELAVILGMILLGHFGVQNLLKHVNRFDLFGEHLNELVTDPRFEGFDCEQPITTRDLQRYNKVYGLPNYAATGSVCDEKHRRGTSWTHRLTSREIRSPNGGSSKALPGFKW